MPDVGFNITGDPSKIQKAFDAAQKKLDELKAKMDGAASASKQQSQEQVDAIGNVTTKIGEWAAGYLTVRSAISLVNAELQNQIDLRRKAAEATMTEADAQRDFLRNFGARTAAERDAAIHQVGAISRETGVSERDLYHRGSAIFSAKGNLSDEQAWSALRESARLVPESQEKGLAVGVASLDLMRATGVKEAAPAMGMMASMARLSHVFDWAKIAQHGVPSVVAAMQSGATAQEAVGLYSTMTYGMADWTGRRSATAVAQFTRQLEKFLPETDMPLYSQIGGVDVQTGTRKGTGLKGFRARLDYLQAHPKEAEAFYQGADVEERAKPTIRGMLGLKEAQPGAEAMAKQLVDLTSQVPQLGEAGAYYEQQRGLIAGAGLQTTAQFGRSLAAAKERLQVGQGSQAVAGMLQKELPEILQMAGQSALASKIMGVVRSAASPEMGMEMAVGEIEQQREWMAGATRTSVIAGVPARVPAPPMNEEDQRAYAVLGEILDVLRRQTQVMEEDRRKQSAAGAGKTDLHSE